MGIFTFFQNSQASEPLIVGAKAPQAAVFNQDGELVNLSDFYAKGVTLVYFYPKADTPGCTAEACSLRDAFVQLQTLGVQVVGVSTDSVADQKKFQHKYHLPFTLLADTEKKVTEAFGVPTTLGFASRQSFLIKNGTVIWRDLKASTKEQAADVLAVLRRPGAE